MAKAYEERTGKPFLSPRMIYTPRMLAAAVNKAGNTNMIEVAKALEDMSLETEIGTITMRGKDHKILMPQVVNTIAPVDGKTVTQGWEGTNYGFRTDAVIAGKDLALDSECQMKRPG